MKQKKEKDWDIILFIVVIGIVGILILAAVVTLGKMAHVLW